MFNLKISYPHIVKTLLAKSGYLNKNERKTFVDKRTSIVGPSFCGKAYLVTTKVKHIHIADFLKLVNLNSLIKS